MRLTPVAAWEPLWPIVGPMLAPSFARGGVTVGEVVEALETGHAQLWIAHEGEQVWMALLTQAGEGEAHIWHLGGREWRRWVHVIDDIKAAARERGFRKITLGGREGWRRLLAPYGFRAVGDQVECEL